MTIILPISLSCVSHFVGAVMEPHAEKFLGLKKCKYLPKHNKQLQNEFRCYANYTTTVLDELS